MTPRQIFILILRAIGIWQFINTIEGVFTSVSIAEGYYKVSFISVQWSWLSTLGHFIVAVWLLGFAPLTASLFYSNEPKKAPDDPPSDTPTI